MVGSALNPKNKITVKMTIWLLRIQFCVGYVVGEAANGAQNWVILNVMGINKMGDLLLFLQSTVSINFDSRKTNISEVLPFPASE